MSVAADQPSSVRSSVVPGPAASAGAAADRRTLSFGSLDDILREVESLALAAPSSIGSWTPAQNIDHVRRLVRFSREGGAIRMPLVFRLLGRLMKSKYLTDRAKPGFKTVDPFLPPEGVSLDDAVAAFREEIRLASRPGAMSQPSPFLGRMTHEQWEQLHCRHAELHLSFVVPSGDATGNTP